MAGKAVREAVVVSGQQGRQQPRSGPSHPRTELHALPWPGRSAHLISSSVEPGAIKNQLVQPAPCTATSTSALAVASKSWTGSLPKLVNLRRAGRGCGVSEAPFFAAVPIM